MITKKHITFFGSGLLLFLFFTIFSYVVDKELLRQLDFDTTVILQDRMSRKFDGIFSWFSVFGNFEVLLIVLIGLLVWLRKIIAGIVTFFFFGVFHIIEIIGKTIVEQLPPPQFMLRTEHPLDFPQFHVRLEYSYPSGHSGRTVFLAVLVVFLIWKSKLPLWVKGVLVTVVLGFTFTMLLSRVYLGEHWATDVLGGALLALSLSLLCVGIYTIPLKKKYL